MAESDQPLAVGSSEGLGVMRELKTVGDYIKALSEFPEDWPVKVATPAGGGIAIEHREIGGKPVVALFGSNGGRFGENPLTDTEYAEQSHRFLSLRSSGYRYTSIHGDHRLYYPGGMNDTCYGTHFDRRIVERMVAEGLVHASEVDVERVAGACSRSVTKMNKRQIEFAARLYELANTACLDLGGCDTAEEAAVVERAAKRCRDKLKRMGYSAHALGSLQACIQAAQRTPNAKVRRDNGPEA